MNTKILDGVACSKGVREQIKQKVANLERKPGLAVILVGDDPASQVYVRNKEKAAREVGFNISVKTFPSTVTFEELAKAAGELNNDPSINGYIVQLPLPKHLNTEKVIELIDPRKDVDGLTPWNQGKLLRGEPGIIPATPRGVLELLEQNNIHAAGKHVVILGRSTIVGRPLGALFLLKGEMGDATVTITHSKTANLEEVCRTADILVAAIGKPRFVTKDFIKPGTVVVDVGMNRLDNGKLCGDVDFDEVKKIASAITPVPGGVGPMTVTMLLQNTLEAALR